MTLDTQIFYLFNSFAGRTPFIDWSVVFLASYLPYLLVVIFLVLIYFSRHSKLEKWEILLVTGASAVIARFGIAEIIRFFYQRPRPFLALSDVHRLFTDPAWSFPSGHATFFFAMSTAMYFYNKTWGAYFFIASILITVSRVIAGVHYPSDIIGGAFIGIIVAYATFYIVKKLLEKGADQTY